MKNDNKLVFLKKNFLGGALRNLVCVPLKALLEKYSTLNMITWTSHMLVGIIKWKNKLSLKKHTAKIFCFLFFFFFKFTHIIFFATLLKSNLHRKLYSEPLYNSSVQIQLSKSSKLYQCKRSLLFSNQQWRMPLSFSTVESCRKI